MEIKGKKILIVGLAKTGEALARFLRVRGALVKISDKKSEEELGPRIAYWRNLEVEVEAGEHRLESFLEADLIIPSPGVPMIPALEEASRRGIPLVSEIELAFHFLKGRVLGVTGTNGKSTTATLIHKILKEAGVKAYLAGNIGTPLISFVDKSRDDHIYVTEISSFQLEHIRDFRAAVSVFLNISINHLDWHASFEDYFRTKTKLVLGQKRGDAAILNRDDKLVWSLARETEAGVFGFSQKREVAKGCFIQDGWIVLRDGKDRRIVKISDIPLPGAHNRDNVMAAAVAGRIFGVAAPVMRRSIRTFRGLEHRLEKVLTLRGVTFVNDSKATTVDATIKALQSFDRKIVLILGGRDKGADFTKLRRWVREKVGEVVLIGEASDKIAAAIKGVRPLHRAASMKETVQTGFSLAKKGEVVLLAPACTSFDWFQNFEHRGRVFKKEVRALAAKTRGTN